MDIEKVVQWVCHGMLEETKQHNGPTGAARLRKVSFFFCCVYCVQLNHFVSFCVYVQDFYERGNGNYPATLTDGKHEGKIHMARIKPYIVSRHLDEYGMPEHFPVDKSRIFARAISNAQAFEKVDICISRQAL